MPVRVDELTTDVTVEGERGGTGVAGGASVHEGSVPLWDRLDATRALVERLDRDAERTRAEAYGD